MSLIAVSSLVLVFAAVQATAPPPESKQFDFWVGKWKCEGESIDAKGNKSHTSAQNLVKRTMDGHVVEENFSMGSFHGQSHSVYTPAAKKWRQTWVDNQGAYIALVGSFENGKMTLQTVANPASPSAASRMVFSNITKDAFDWNWESTSDGGKTWKLNWHLHYTRQK